MELLRRLRLDAEWVHVFDPESHRLVKMSWEDRLFDMVKVQLETDNASSEDPKRVAWLVRAGQWAYYWLNPAGCVYVANVARVLLELDHRTNRGPSVMAKKLGIRLVLLHYACRRPVHLRLNIANLLSDIGDLPRPEVRGRNWAATVRTNFEEALMLLGPGDADTPGHKIISSVEWPHGFGPDDADRSKGWVDQWLSASLTVEVYDPSRESSDAARPSSTRKSRQVKAPVEQIRRLRLRHEPRCTQKELAKRLNISRSYLSQVETSRRVPSKTLEADIDDWAESRESE
jgi:DNA-binding XRE family transcriptional regulator